MPIKRCTSKCLSAKSVDQMPVCRSNGFRSNDVVPKDFFMVGIYKDLLTIIHWVNCALSRLWSLHFQFVLCYIGTPVKILNAFLKKHILFSPNARTILHFIVKNLFGLHDILFPSLHDKTDPCHQTSAIFKTDFFLSRIDLRHSIHS